MFFFFNWRHDNAVMPFLIRILSMVFLRSYRNIKCFLVENVVCCLNLKFGKRKKIKHRYAVSCYAVTPLPVTPLRVLLTTHPIIIRLLNLGLVWIFSSSTEECAIETSNELNIQIINIKSYSSQERLTGFHCKRTIFSWFRQTMNS